MAIARIGFGTFDGHLVPGFVLIDRDAGLRATVIAYGARLVGLEVPDRSGVPADVVLGFEDLDGYLADRAYMGAVCGRYGNRIAGAGFELDGVRHQLSVNEAPNHLHGGLDGFDSRLWEAAVDEDDRAVRFSLVSPAGDQGYPGALTATVTYRLLAGGMLSVRMTATTDHPTIVNLVHHPYWNLGGPGSVDSLRHWLKVDAASMTPVDEGLIPTGEVRPVAGTGFDLRAGVCLGTALAAVGGAGFDHNFCLGRDRTWTNESLMEARIDTTARFKPHPDPRQDPAHPTGKAPTDPRQAEQGSFDLPNGPDPSLRPAATLTDPVSGRCLTIRTNQPGLQVYTGGHLGGGPTGKGGVSYGRFAGIALEPQRFPNAPNTAWFPSARLDVGQIYDHRVEYAFSSL